MTYIERLVDKVGTKTAKKLICERYGCRKAGIVGGDVWIEEPHVWQWLDADMFGELSEWIERRVGQDDG